MQRARVAAALIGLFLVGLLLIIAGIQGSFGRMMCVIFAPGRLAITREQEAYNPGSEQNPA